MNLILEKTETNKQLLLKAANVAWPAILESFFVALVALVDSFMVSGVGAYAVAAVGLTTQPKFVCLAVFIAINTSVSVLIARRKGQDERESANRILITAIICVLFNANFNNLFLLKKTLCAVYTNLTFCILLNNCA